MGDDVYSKTSIAECAKNSPSIVVKISKKYESGSRIVIKNKNLVGYETNNEDGLVFTGLYCLSKEIFRYKPVKLQTKDEYGLPQTLLKLAKNKKVKIIKTKHWMQISSPEDLIEAEKFLQKWPKKEIVVI